MSMRVLGAAIVCGALTLLGVAVPAGPAVAATVVVIDEPSLLSAFDNATNGDVIQLDADIDVSPDEGAVVVPEGVTLTLDLDGQTLEIVAAEERAGIQVSGTSGIVINDTAGGGNLTVAGGYAAAGIGGEKWASGGTITINAGTVSATGSFGAGIGGGIHGDAGTVTINGGTVTAQSAPGSFGRTGAGAGIGGAGNAGSGIITINGGTVNATGSGVSAGIGGGGASGGHNGGVITINGGDVVAKGGIWGGAGIGSAAGRSAGPVTITGGTVTATGGGGDGLEAGPGIGQSRTGPLTVTISGGNVTSVGGSEGDQGAAGIGGGSNADGAPVSITGGNVTARGVNGAAGIGGGHHPEFDSSGATVEIGPSARVVVEADGGGNAIGYGAEEGEFGSLTNAGSLTVASGSTLTIPEGIAVMNSGTLTATGDVVNDGTIVNTGTVDNPQNVSVHNYLLSFDLGDANGDGPAQQRVFASTFDDAQMDLPADPQRAGYTFTGWQASAPAAVRARAAVGAPLAGDTVLGGGADGPLTQTWIATWQQVVLSPPVWAAGEAADFKVGVRGSEQFLVDRADSVAQTAGALPDGLEAEMTPAGVTISGTPAAGTKGSYRLQFTATNPDGNDVLSVTVTVVAADPADDPADDPTDDTDPQGSPIVDDPVLPDTGAGFGPLPLGVALVLIALGSATMFRARRRTP